MSDKPIMEQAEWQELEALVDGPRHDELLAKTWYMSEHPEGYEGPCMCELCRSYSD